MPEGHSLELAARRLAPVLGQPVTEGPLCGATLEAVEARGKHLLIHGDRGRSLAVHLGMHGKVRLAAPGLGRGRTVLRTPTADVVIAGTLRVREQRRERVAPRLGPDLLHGRFDGAEYLRRMRLVERSVAEALLDQRAVAGIGNIVRCEALWERAVDPFAPVSALADRRVLELAVTARRLLRDGVAAGGPLASRVYRRVGRPCPRCRAPIVSRAVGEPRRWLYWCPGCQRSR
jgi:endonuclease VIII